MSAYISQELHNWIATAVKAGAETPQILQSMREVGYDMEQYAPIVVNMTAQMALSLKEKGETAIPRFPVHPEGPFVEAGGRQVRVAMSRNAPAVRLLEGLLTEAECSELIAGAEPRLERSRTFNGADGVSHKIDEARTSSGTFYKRKSTPLIESIDQRIADIVGMPPEYGEDLQLLRYEPGQEYKPHFDWFHPDQPGYSMVEKQGGQRVASVVMYLNTPEKGGGTEFPELGLTITALQGSAVYFAYKDRDRATLHAGLPVVEGIKWIATKWFRERPFPG